MYLLKNLKLNKSVEEKKFIYKKRVIEIINYIEKNYNNENLNTNDIADFFSLSQQHLLKIFRENFHMTLSDYINSLRIRKSLEGLLYTNKVIIEIAIENGFNDNKSYNRIFKNYLGVTPGSFRKMNAFKKVEFNSLNDNDVNLKNLLINIGNKLNFNDNLLDTNTSIINIKLNNNREKKITHSWKNIIYLGEAFEGLKADIQYQIKQLKQDLTPHYIKITEIFNDNMNTYLEDNYGNVSYNFHNLDKLIEFCIKLDLKPYINIGFMPKKLSEKDIYLFSSNTNISFPKSLNNWKLLIKNTFTHLLEKYGELEVASWYFEIWDSPNCTNIYWKDSDENFFYFFEETYNSIKIISRKFKVGSPSLNCKINFDWIINFIKFIKNKEIKLDFFSISYYEHHFNNKEIKLNINNKDFIEISEDIIKNYGEKIDIFIENWDFNIFLNESNDSCEKSIFIIENVLKDLDSKKKFLYFLSVETKAINNFFYGSTSLFSSNNLKKASYNAFILLNKLGDNLIEKGENYFITRKNEDIQIILYNQKNSYPKEIIIYLENSNNQKYQITKYYLDSQSGSIYEAWLNMGSPINLNEELYNFLKTKELMSIKVDFSKNHDNSIEIKEKLDINSIVFIDMKNTGNIFYNYEKI